MGKNLSRIDDYSFIVLTLYIFNKNIETIKYVNCVSI